MYTFTVKRPWTALARVVAVVTVAKSAILDCFVSFCTVHVQAGQSRKPLLVFHRILLQRTNDHPVRGAKFCNKGFCSPVCLFQVYTSKLHGIFYTC